VSVDAVELATVDRELGDHAPLPRDNGELVFEEPWQGRALGMGVVVLERTGAPWSEFRGHLAAYYTCWLDALDALLAERGILEHGP
jgi:hypothetical protein